MDYDVALINSAKLNHREVEYDRYKFYFFTYVDEFLRNLQIYYIAGELEQSAGRARLLNNDNTVYVYSAMPLKQAEFVDSSLAKGTEEVLREK